MDQFEELELLKKKLFKIEFSLKMKLYKDSFEHKDLLDQKREIIQKRDLLNEEINMSDGQMAFAFADLIDFKE